MTTSRVRPLGWPLPSSLSMSAALLGAAASTGVAAQTEPIEPTLKPIVVTASRREQEVRTAPASVTVITRQDIESRPETSVTDLLRSVEGVSVVGANPNDRDITLRGMPGDYTLLLVDGQRQNTRETMNRGTGGVQSNLLPPLAAIERIEVVRGPMSSLYGSDAIGGVVNIITRKLPKAWTGSAEAHAVHQQHEEIGDSRGVAFWLGGPVQGDALGVQISGSTQRRDEDDVYYPLNATNGANGQRDERLDFKATGRLTANQTLTLNAGHQDFTYLTTPGLSIADASTAATVLTTRHRRDHWGLTHEGRWDWGRSTIALYGETGTQTQATRTGNLAVEPETRNTTLDGRAVLPWSDANVLTVGAQANQQRLNGVAVQDAVPAGLAANPDTVQRDSFAVFGENDFAFNRDFTLTTGARLDHDERYGHHVSPRIYGVYTLDSAWTVRGGIATGFKAPTLRQSTGGYCMTTGGAAGAAAGTLCGNADLKPETSISGEVGLRWDTAASNASVTVFDNRIKNRVASYDTGVPDPRVAGRNIYVYENIARVDISGIELAAGTELGHGLRVSGNYTLTDSKRRAGGENAFDGTSLEGRPLDKTPKHKATLRVDWQALQSLDLSASVDYVGKQYWAAFRNGALNVRERPATTTLDLGGRYTIVRGVDVKLGVQNVTDRRVDVDSRARTGGLNGNWMVDEGRRVVLSLSVES